MSIGGLIKLVLLMHVCRRLGVFVVRLSSRCCGRVITSCISCLDWIRLSSSAWVFLCRCSGCLVCLFASIGSCHVISVGFLLVAVRVLSWRVALMVFRCTYREFRIAWRLAALLLPCPALLPISYYLYAKATRVVMVFLGFGAPPSCRGVGPPTKKNKKNKKIYLSLKFLSALGVRRFGA